MKKNVAKVLALILAVVSCIGLMTACSAPSVAGTYTFTVDPTDVAGNSQHSAFLADAVPSQVNTLVLNEDGTYSLTKKLDEDSIHINIEFTGTYTFKDSDVTLAAPTDVIWDVDWGQFIEMGFFPGVLKGQLSKGDTGIMCGRIIQPDNSIGGGHDPKNMFLTPYYLDSEKTGTQDITVNKGSKTFTYAVEASSEDD